METGSAGEAGPAPEPGHEARPAEGAPSDGRGAPAARSHRSPGRFLRDQVETVLVASLVVLFATTFVVQNSVIPSASMEDTLLIGDYVLVNKVIFAPADRSDPASWLAMRPLRHGDIVVFKFPSDPRTDYVKRIVGLAGDTIEVRDKVVWRNGSPLKEPWVVHRTGVVHPRGSSDGPRDNFGPVSVPDGMLFVMGDNRDYSRDSREFGFVPAELVTGRALVVFWSKTQRPGAFARHRGDWRSGLASLRSFHRDVRWGRLLTVIR